MIGKKSLKDIAWNVTEEEYRADSAYSYSTLAKFDREGFEKIDTLFDRVESPSLLFGSCVDTLLTDGQKAFDERFFVADFPDIPLCYPDNRSRKQTLGHYSDLIG